MLPIAHKIAFLVFGLVTVLIGIKGFYRLYKRIRAGRSDSDARLDKLLSRIWYALTTALLQRRTFPNRPVISLFHAFMFYGFVWYLIVNVADGIDGYYPFTISSTNLIGRAYNLSADLLTTLVLIGVVALVARRFVLPARRDFRFNERTLLHEQTLRYKISWDSLIVSTFILFHVGSRAIGAGAKLSLGGPDRFQPFATLLSNALAPVHAESWRIFGYWGALGSALAFLMYFPYSKHIHIFMAPIKYLVARHSASGVLPALDVNLETKSAIDEHKLGAKMLEDLSWPRLLDAYACIQCNRCQDVCPASATGKSLSPAALEINKRMELNSLANHHPEFEEGSPSLRPLLDFALTPEAAWACTTCGACMQVCPVQDEQMLDIVDIRRNQVMIEGKFPTQLQTAFRAMERSRNPWGINHEQRMAWAAGLKVSTINENPNPDVLYWVGCVASYDPHTQKTARAFVQLLLHAGVNFAVLGKEEWCTGDSARRAGNEYLYTQLARHNIETLNRINPRLIVTACPHCANAIGKEYRQLGGNYKVVHHTEYLASLISEGKLDAEAAPSSITYHDPCYLGRHNGVYDAPRNVLRVLSNDVVELDRSRENSFCCGAGGAQFWKEEEAGSERIADNRYREVQLRLADRNETKVLAVGCPFCKNMLGSARGNDVDSRIEIKDVAELLLEGVLRKSGESVRQNRNIAFEPAQKKNPTTIAETAVNPAACTVEEHAAVQKGSRVLEAPATSPVKAGEALPSMDDGGHSVSESIRQLQKAKQDADATPARKKWAPKGSSSQKG
jgi:Fe-S oxidoreductase